MEGRVTKYFDDRGFGFVRRDDGKDIFFHIKSFAKHVEYVAPGDRVEFTVESTPKGPAAVDIKLIKNKEG